MASRKIKVEDLRRIVFVSDPQVSPDGDRVAFVHTKIDHPNDKYVKHVWMWDRETSAARQFTHGAGSDSFPRWSPDGEKLLFLSSNRLPEQKKSQIWVIPSSGGEASLVAGLENSGVANPAWASDSRRILFTSRVWAGEKPKTDVMVVTRLNYRLNGTGYYPGKRVHLFSVRLGGKPRQLTKGEFDVEAASWSPDGKEIALVTNPAEDADLTLVKDIYAIPSKGGEMRQLTGGKHYIGGLSYAPSGEEVAYLGHDRRESGATNTDIWAMPSEGGDAENLTALFDRSVGRGIGSDLRVSTPSPGAVWSPDSASLFFLTGTVPTSNVYRVDRATREIEQVTEGVTVDGFSLSADASVMAFNVMDSTHPAELWVRDAEGDKRVTKFNDRLLKRLDLSLPERYAFKNVEGDDIDAWVMKPPDFEQGKKYPAVVQIHGGPLGIYGDGIYQEFHLLNAAGYAVLYTNPRGSGGYGEAYAASLQGRHGTVDHEDIMTFVDDALERFEFIDPGRLGVTGGSYGGYLTNWMITQTDRFSAAVSCRSTCNRFSHHGNSDRGWMHGLSGNMGFPYKDEEKLMLQSPIRYVANAKTPTLLIHSEEDLRCPVWGAEEFFTSLLELGVETELVRFPGENHELSRSGKPKHREERLQHILRWFEKHL